MNRIVFPLKLQMRRPTVSDLHQALLFLGFEIAESEQADGRFGATTRKAVIEFQRQHRLETTGVVDELTAALLNEILAERGALGDEPADEVPSYGNGEPEESIVKGRVRQADGSPLAGAVVRAYDKGFRDEAILGEATTDRSGRYRIVYTAEQLQRRGKTAADLSVRLVRDGQQVGESGVVFQAQPVESVDLVVHVPQDGRPSEYESLVAEFAPLIGDVRPADLTDEDVAFLAGKTGIEARRIESFVQAARLGEQTELPPEALYGLIGRGAPESPELFAREPGALRDALESSVRERVVPASVGEDLDALLERIQELRVEYALQGLGGRPPMDDLLATVLTSGEERRAFAARFLRHQGMPEALWIELREDAQLDDELVGDLEFTFEAAELTGHHLPLVRRLQKLRREGSLRSVRELARLDARDWKNLAKGRIDGRAAEFSPGTQGDTDEEKAQHMVRAAETAFPTAAIAYRLERDDAEDAPFDAQERQDLAAFVLDNPGFEFGHTIVDEYMEEKGASALEEVSDGRPPTERLKQVQRVFKLTPRYEEMRALLGDGVDSARGAARMGKDRFVATYGERLGGEAQATTIYEKAEQQSATALALFAKYNRAFDPIDLPVMGAPVTQQDAAGLASESADAAEQLATLTKRVPDLETLFGSQDLCDCEECRSVYSPAAYLVDSLAFLQERPSQVAGKTVLDVLLDPKRRADIGTIELSCENTNTRLPYIDLVNEVLEDVIAPPGTRRRQTRGTTEELLVNPEYTNAEAYSTLANAVYPWSLPFDRWVEEERIYLRQLGLRRDELLATFRKKGTRYAPTSLATVSEHLGLTTAERRIITDAPANPPSPWRYWGFGAATITGQSSGPVSWVQALSRVPEFLRRSGLSHDELVELLDTGFVNPNGSMTVHRAGTGCKLEDLSITNLTGDALIRMLRFLRLLRPLGWKMRDLDRAITALKPEDRMDRTRPTKDFLRQISHAGRLQAELNVPLLTVLSWWAQMDTADYETEGLPKEPSLYRQVFLNKAVMNPPDEAFEPTRIASGGGKISEHLPAILAALRISAADLALLTESEVTDDELNLENLSYLYRVTSFARALKLPISEFLALKKLSRIHPVRPHGRSDPVQTHETLDTLRFVERVRKIRKLGLSVAELEYLLRHAEQTPGKVAPTEDQIAQLLWGLHEGLQKIVAETGFAPDTTGEMTRRNLAILFEGERLEQAMALIEGKALVEGDPTRDAAAKRTFIDSHFAAFLNAAEAKAKLVGANALTELAGRLEYVLAPLMAYLRRSLSEKFVVQELGEALGVEPDLMRLLLQEVLQSHAQSGKPAMHDFLQLAGPGVGDGLSATYFDNPDLTGATMSRIDPTVGFSWGLGSPVPLFADTFGARWTGKVLAPHTETYTFYTNTDDGARLWVDGQLLVDGWVNQQQPAERQGTIELEAGRLYDIKMEYYRSGGQATVRLLWSSPKITKAVVPREKLFSGSTSAPFRHLLPSYHRVYKAALLTKKMRITAHEMAYLSAHKADFGGFDFNELPVDDAGTRRRLLDQSERLYDLFLLRDSLPRGGAGLFRVFEVATASADPNNRTLSDATLGELALATGWDRAELALLAHRLELVDDDFRNEIAVHWLQACFGLSKRVGIPVTKLHSWATVKPDEEQAQETKNAAKAKYGDAEWLRVARPLADTLREKQRSALVAYLVAHPDALGGAEVRDSNELFEHLLIDVDMSPCQTTSRIQQAISSVQMFVQRCLMNLEPEVVLTPQDAAQWKWRKNYRVWEANRRIFLYPENLLEPELRDDKTPFFVDLENELLQNEVTTSSAEDAFRRYLEKLDSVARLEIVGMFDQFEPEEGVDVLHVFGRTLSEPHVYYYRRRVDSSYWTAWTPVDVDISGSHLVPVVHDRRLQIYWLIFTEKADGDEIPPENGATDAEKLPSKYYEAQLAWSEYKDGKWLPKETSPDTIELRTLTEKQSLLLSAAVGVPSFPRVQPVGYPNLPVLDVRWFEWLGTTGSGSGSANMPAELTGVFRALQGQRVPRRVRSLHGDYLDESLGVNWIERADVPEGVRLEHGMFCKDAPGLYDDNLAASAPIYGLEVLKRTPKYFRILRPLHSYRSPFHPAHTVNHEREYYDENGKRSIVTGKKWIETPFFYQDEARTFLLIRQFQYELNVQDWWGIVDARWSFETFYHPRISEFMQELSHGGVPALLRRVSQLGNRDLFALNFEPLRAGGGVSAGVPTPYPREEVDVSYSGAYSQYNWELFFHIPLLIADRLSKNQRFEEAQKWFHFVFDPTADATHGLRATYFENADLTGSSITRIDPNIDFDWGSGSPDPEIYPDTFSAEWTGKVQPEHTETYTFYTRTDDGVKLSVNGQEIISNWVDHQSPTEQQGTIHLEAGKLYDIKMQFYENEGGAVAQLKWSRPSTPKTVIPQNRLYPGAEFDIPGRYWNFRRFFEDAAGRPIQELMQLLSYEGSDPDLQKDKEEFENQVLRWLEDPFKPHLIARLRTNAYQKGVVMKYLDNVIAWGDHLFRQDTLESINEATQLYVLAASILGRRPAILPEPKREEKTFDDLKDGLELFSNTLAQVENLIAAPSTNGRASASGTGSAAQLLDLPLYFGIPRNERLLEYWNTVEDRLFKIRHCQNIEGVERQLPLFPPRIDPELLARAAAAGVDIGSVLGDVSAALPHYRFSVMLQKATEMCADVKALGAALLSALEKQDAEELALLRSGQEIQLLGAVKQVKEKQIEEADESLEGLGNARKVTEARRNYYQDISRVNPKEQLQLDKLASAHEWEKRSQILEILVGAAAIVPQFDAGISGAFSSPVVKAEHGGINLAAAARSASRVMSYLASLDSYEASRASIEGGHDRRWDEWKHQENLANKELDQIDKQIAAAELRKEIAELELENYERQVENAKAVDTLMRSKFSNKELYGWMVSQISMVFFQSYQLAYDMAKRAEKAYRFERGLKDSSFIRSGYWDSLKKGLLSGERLHLDLKRLEMAYLDQNRRDYEITKHISLVLHDPLALITLKETGRCYVSLPEALFDMDYPGHYMRRIKSVSLTIPAVTGPYTSINCTLTLRTNRIRTDPRIDTSVDNDYQEKPEDGRFAYDFGSVQSIATSHAQNDGGMFELNFRDERYLPFEGAGAISEWCIDLPKETNAFDFDTISDVILKISYTARDGGDQLPTEALAAAVLPEPPQQEMPDAPIALPSQQNLHRMFSAKHEFLGEWQRFLRPPDTASDQRLEFELTSERFPFRFRGMTIEISRVDVFLVVTEKQTVIASDPPETTYQQAYAEGSPLKMFLTPHGGNPNDDTADKQVELRPDLALRGLAHGAKEYGASEDLGLGTWVLKVREADIPSALQLPTNTAGHRRLNPQAIEDVLIVCHYSATR